MTKIVVLAGGESSERRISLKSGQAVYAALRKRFRNVLFIDVERDFKERLRLLNADVAFIALHGRFGEDGTIQRALDGMGMPYTGSGGEASRLAMDKIASRRIFAENGLKVPLFKTVDRSCRPKEIIKEFNLPFVIKPVSEGSSVGLSVVRAPDEIGPALEKAFECGDRVIAEEYIDGRELTVGILDRKPLPVIEIVAERNIYDYKAKYEDANTRYVVPARVNEKTYKSAQLFAHRAHDLLGCRDFSRTDMRVAADGSIYILEVNTIPGMTERSLLPKAASAAGFDFVRLCVKLVDLAGKRRKTENAQS